MQKKVFGQDYRWAGLFRIDHLIKFVFPLLLITFLFELAYGQAVFKGDFSSVNPSFVGQNRSIHGYRAFLTKEKGDGSNTYFLNLVGENGALEKSIEFSRLKNWFPVDLSEYGDDLVLFFNQIDRETRKSTSGALIIDIEDEEISDEIQFDDVFIGEWAGNDAKGATLQSFERAMESFRDPGLSIPFDYKFFLAHSPSGDQHLLYRYDYSKEDLFARILWLNESLEVTNQKELMLDQGRVNVALYVNDVSDLFVLNTDALGLMELVKFDSSLQDFDFLQVPPGHAARDDFILKFLTDDLVFVASKVDYEGEFEGVFYAKFNFVEGDVDRIHFFKVEDELKERVDSINMAAYGENVDWDEFHLVLFEAYNEEELLIGIEEVHIESSGKKYYPWQIDEPTEFQAHKSVIMDGMIGLFSFNLYDENRWNFWIPKKGKNDILKYAVLPNFQTDFEGGDRIAFYERNYEKSAEIKRVDFDYYYALEPKEEMISIGEKNANYFPGLLFKGSENAVLLPYETKNGSAGIFLIEN